MLAECKLLFGIYADSNNISFFPPEIGAMDSLQQINLSRNNLTTFPPALCYDTNLTYVDVSRNKLTEIPDRVFGLKKCNAFNVENNRLCNVSQEMSDWLSTRSYQWQTNQVCESGVTIHPACRHKSDVFALSVIKNGPLFSVSYTLPTARNVQIALYTPHGRLALRLASGQKSNGTHFLSFATQGLGSGVYVVRMQAGEVTIGKSVAVY